MLIQLSVFLQAFVTFSVDKSEMPHVAHSPRPSQGPKARPLATRAFASDPALGDGAPHRLYLARKNGQPTAAALETTAPDGYSGAIKLLVGADFNGTVLGTRVIEHHETPGLGDKIELRISDWISFFSGKKIEGPDDKRWAVKKDGGMFDQFTGATITPRAVVNAVRRTALYMETLPPKLESLPACGASE